MTAVQAVQSADPLTPATVLAPSAPLALRLRRAIARAGSGYFGLRVCTLADFAREIAEESLLQEGKRPLPPLAAPLLMKRFLSEQETNNYFSALASLPGIPRSVLATVTELQQSGISPSLLRAFLDHAPQGKVSRQKLTSLCALYEQYTSFLAEQKCYDANGIMERAIELLQTAALDAPVFVYGFSDFTPLQRRLVAAAVSDRDALVFFPWRAGNAYASATPTLTWLTNLGFQTISLGRADNNETHLTRLQIGVFEEPTSAQPLTTNNADQSVRFLSAPGKSREVREIGRVILHLVRTQGVRFHEIGVFLREPETYGLLCVDTFQNLGIPICLHGGLSLLQTPAGQRLLLLCQVLLEDYARFRVIEFIRGVDPPLSALLGEQAGAARLTQWELFSAQAGVVKGAQAWRDRLPRLLADQQNVEEEEPHTIDQQALRAFIAFMEGFLTASEQKRQRDSWRGWTDFVLHLMESYISPTDHTHEVEDALRNLTKLDCMAGTISFAEWTRGATAALTAATVAVGALDKEGVFVGSLLAARGLRFRAVIIPGLVDGSFPQVVRQDPFLLDQERQYLSEFSACELRQRRSQSETESLFFVLAVQSAQDWVIFSYPYAEGDLQRTPSFFLLRAIEALRGTSASFVDLRDWEQRMPFLPTVAALSSEALDSLEYHLLSVARAVASGDSTSLGYLPLLSPFFSSALHAARQRWHETRLTVFDGMIEDEGVKEKLQAVLFSTEMRLSASALETYARCPFRYFLSTVLGLSQSEEPERIVTLQPRERGSLLHGILHDFFTRARERGMLSSLRAHKTSLHALLSQVAEEHCRRFSQRSVTGFPLLWEIEQERMRERLAAFLQQECEAEEEFLPAAFEVRFGSIASEAQNDNWRSLLPDGPVWLPLSNGEKIALRGRIDRIDFASDQRRARLVDYKTGKPIRGRFAGGTALQLPLYLYAARALWPEKIWESATYLYVDRERKAESPLFTMTNWESSLSILREIVAKLMHSLRGGCFPMTPEECLPCPFPLICGGLAARRAAQKQQDPRLDALHAVRAVE